MRKSVDVAPTLDNTSDEVEPPAEHLDLTQPAVAPLTSRRGTTADTRAAPDWMTHG